MASMAKLLAKPAYAAPPIVRTSFCMECCMVTQESDLIRSVEVRN